MKRYMKDSFIFFKDWYDVMGGLSDKERLSVYDAIMQYAFEGKMPEDKLVSYMTALIRKTIDRTNGKYEDVRNKRKEAAQKRWEQCKPTIEEVDAYCRSRGNNIDAEAFWSFYESKGWVVGKSPMKDWKQAVITWEKKREGVKNHPPVGVTLGVGEWIDENGERRYGTGRLVPMNAPRRPREDCYWSAESNRWVSGV